MADIVKSISEIFSNQIFRVPDYQRGYSWEEKQWNDLLEDLEVLKKDHNHFTGTLVLRPNGNGEKALIDIEGKAYTDFDIIDGQQRLTTIVILLKAIDEQMQLIDDFKALSHGLQETYLHQLDINQRPFTKLTLNEDCQEFFANHILTLSPEIPIPTIRSHERLLGAKQRFTNYLEEQKKLLGDKYPKWLRDLYFKIIHHLIMIVYPVENELDAGVIFETMNDRGKPLTELELVKNYLLYVSDKLELKTAHDLNHRINSVWKFIYENLMIAGLGGRQYEDQLLRVHWLMVYDYDPGNWQNNRSIKNRFSLRKYQDRDVEMLSDLTEYLSTLQKTTTAFCDIYSPTRNGAFSDIQDPDLRTNIGIWSKKFNRLGTRVGFLPILIAVRYKAGDGGQSYLKILELCEKYDFRVYELLRYRANAGESKQYRLGYQYFHKPDTSRLETELARSILDYCSDERFLEKFNRVKEDWYHYWNGLYYFLYEYEHHLAGGHGVNMTFESLSRRPKSESIEHILPQTPEHNYWKERFTHEQVERWTHDIGNLTLTFDNSELGNRPFPEKKGQPGQIKRYAGSPLFIEHQIAVYDDWTETQIVERREQIKAWAVNRWHVDPPPKQEKPTRSIERMQALADQNGIGEEFDKLHKAALKLNLDAVIEKNIRYRPPFNWILSVMNVDISPGGFWVYFRLHNFAKYPSVTRDQINELLPYANKQWNWITAENSQRLIDGLEGLYELVKDRLKK